MYPLISLDFVCFDNQCVEVVHDSVHPSEQLLLVESQRVIHLVRGRGSYQFNNDSVERLDRLFHCLQFRPYDIRSRETIRKGCDSIAETRVREKNVAKIQ
jgi:hypothetical protein